MSFDLESAVMKVQKRLDDEDGVVWTDAELKMYIQDGYDLFCRRTRCLFDIWVVENTPQVGNWSTDLERFLLEQSSGKGLTDERLHFTADIERNKRVGGLVGGSTEGPTPATSPHEGAFFDHFEQPAKVATSRLPNSIVDIIRVTWDELEVYPENSPDMRMLDLQYERREGGDPRHFTFDKDGFKTLRLIPPARADADYDTVDGSWGTMTQTSDTTVTVVGAYGILREIDGAFPSWGPHGTPTRQHPAAKNISVEVARLGRPLSQYCFEIPAIYIKFVLFWAMRRALQKNGPGQDLKLSKHYEDRFEMGIARMKTRLRKVNKEIVLSMGSMRAQPEPFGNMGDPTLPYPYGPRGRRFS